jgi:probable F420-dependent oxidoreductase
VDDLVAVATTAEALGYGWVGCPEHTGIPVDVAARRGGRYYDPVATLSYLAATTTSLRLLPHVVVLGYHHPLEIVKRYGTLDVLSGGRVVLGVGVGSLAAEFELLGEPYDDRGARADDALRAIRASWGREVATYDGSHHQFADWIVEPSGLRSQLPIWVGGLTARSLRRAVELGDGWVPFGLTLDQLGPMLAGRIGTEARARAGFEIVLAPEPILDPLGDPDGAARAVAAYADVGATALALRFRSTSRSHYLEQLEAMVSATAAAGHAVEPMG